MSDDLKGKLIEEIRSFNDESGGVDLTAYQILIDRLYAEVPDRATNVLLGGAVGALVVGGATDGEIRQHVQTMIDHVRSELRRFENSSLDRKRIMRDVRTKAGT